MRLVLDTDVMVAALRSQTGASRQLVQSALNRQFEMLVSVAMMLEYEAVLTRPENLRAAGVSAGDMGIVLDAIGLVLTPVRIPFIWRPQLRDPNDEMVLETAVNGQADVLVTFNLKHLAAAARRFGIRTCRPGNIWREIRGKQYDKK